MHKSLRPVVSLDTPHVAPSVRRTGHGYEQYLRGAIEYGSEAVQATSGGRGGGGWEWKCAEWMEGFWVLLNVGCVLFCCVAITYIPIILTLATIYHTPSLQFNILITITPSLSSPKIVESQAGYNQLPVTEREAEEFLGIELGLGRR
ncbi:hypothetical protein EON63_04300, partial [archaeon]